MYRIILLLLLVALTFPSSLLDNGVGLSGLQLGGAYTANPTGADAIYWNMANLAITKKEQIYITYAQTMEDVSKHSILYSINLNSQIYMAFAYLQSGIENNPYTDGSGNYIGSGSFDFLNQAMLVGLAMGMNEDSGVGLTVTNITQKAIQNSSVLSLGLSYKTKLAPLLHLGIVVDNVYSNDQVGDTKPIYRAGLSLKDLYGWMLTSDYDYYSLLQKGYPRIGICYEGMQLVSLKCGYSEYDKLFYAGMTVNLANLQIDYCFSNPELGAIHQLGIGFNFKN